MNGPWLRGLALALIVAAGAGDASGQTEPRGDSKSQPRKMVLVELYTSQGCDMCPTAEKMLGALAERDRRIVPIAFHVDYFNEPWKDVFSDPLYSQRQMAYNQLYTKPKNPEYGLYYTPMLMIDGEQSVNGRDPASAEAAIRQALARKPAVRLDVALDLKSDGLSGTATIKVTSRSARAEKSPLLVCAVLREDGVVTDVPSGENAGKSLVARFPARQTKYEFIELDGKSPATQRFPFAIEPTWNRQNLRLAVFVQDKRTGVVHQATDLPWRSTPTAATVDIQVDQRQRPTRSLRPSVPCDPTRSIRMSFPIRSIVAVVLMLHAGPRLLFGASGRRTQREVRLPEEQTGLKVGEKAPGFTLKDQEGKERSLDEFLKKGKVALVFYRSADW